MVKKKIYKDKRLRIRYMLGEFEYFLVKSFISNSYLKLDKFWLEKSKLRLGGKFVKINNYCLNTGKSGGINKKNRLFRLELMKLINSGSIEGLKKISSK